MRGSTVLFLMLHTQAVIAREYVDTKICKMKALEKRDLCFEIVFGLQILNLDFHYQNLNCKKIKFKPN